MERSDEAGGATQRQAHTAAEPRERQRGDDLDEYGCGKKEPGGAHLDKSYGMDYLLLHRRSRH